MNIQRILQLLIVAIVLMAAFSLLGVVINMAQTLLNMGLKMLLLLLVVFIVLSVVNGFLGRKK